VREFVVTLHSGKKYTVRADRVALIDHVTLALVVDPPPALGGPTDNPVAVFDRHLVTCVIAADHLVGEADDPAVVADPNADIPF
jgi:hypothetical protein